MLVVRGKNTAATSEDYTAQQERKYKTQCSAQ